MVDDSYVLAITAEKAAAMRKPVKKKVRKKQKKNPETYVAVGIDLSTSSVAMAGFAWDATLRRRVGPATASIRWERGVDYFVRLAALTRPQNLVEEIFAQLHVFPEPDEVFIAIEEPWPFGMQKRAESNALKQQAQISGVLIGGLMRYGWLQIFEIHNVHWKQIVARDLGISSHWSKYGKGVEGKMRSKEWALKTFQDVPDWPDLIQHSKRGLIPRPENSKAKTIQCDDRYDAIAIAVWMREEVERSLK